VILIDVQSILLHTLTRHAGADDLRQAIYVIGFNIQAALNLGAHAFAPGFRPKKTPPQLKVFLGAKASLARGLCEVDSVGGSTA
jgi:hypothetical protein